MKRMARRMSERGADRVRNLRAGSEGFTLMELMIVVILVSILALIALPSLGEAKFDRHAYDDAGLVMQLFRVARTRAIGRGGAVLVRLHADVGNGDRGTYELWDAVRANADPTTGTGVGGNNRTPVSSCKSPTQWTLDKTNPATANAIFVDGVSLNGSIEGLGNVESIVVGASGAPTTQDVYVCVTPLGRTYVATTTPNFDASPIAVGVLQVYVYRSDAAASVDPTFPGLNIRHQGPVRTVLVPSSGMPRVLSR
jgi:prepilin-type N-terminal cleavage/methylation domain-containing protein